MADFPTFRHGRVPLPVQQVVDRIVDAHCMSLINDRAHSKRALLTFSWQKSDTTGGADSTQISDLMKGTFGFHTESFEIPSRKSIDKVQKTVGDFIKKHDDPYSRSLLIFHYAGHGGMTGGQLHLLPFQAGSTSTIPFDGLRATMRGCKADVLILLDCCHAAAACRGAGDRTVEILAACDEAETTEDGRNSFTTRFCEITQELSRQGILSIEMISRSMAKRFSHQPKPSHSRLEGTGPISLDGTTRLSHGVGQHLDPIDRIHVCVQVDIRIDTAEAVGIERPLINCMNYTMINPSYRGEVLDLTISGKKAMATLQLPLQTAEWLRADLDFKFIRWDPGQRAGTTMATEDIESLFNNAPEGLKARIVRLHQVAQSWHSSDRNTRIKALSEKISLLIHEYGSESTYILSSLRKLAAEYEEAGLFREAARERELAVQIFENSGCPHEPNSRFILDLYLAGRAYGQAKEYEKELNSYKRMVGVWSQTPDLKYLSFLTLEGIEYDIRSLEKKVDARK
jgi:Caspase domain